MSVFTRCLFLFFAFCLSVFVVICVVRGSLYQTMDIEINIYADSIVVVVTLLSYIVVV